MSSMTLKEFMTRGNGGMEKRAVGFDLKPGYTETGDLPFLYYNPSKKGGTYFAKSPLITHLLATRDFTPEQSKVYYESHFKDNPELQKQILEEAARLLPYFSNEWNSNKEAFINNLNADDILKALVKQYNKTNGTNLTPGDFLSSQINNLPFIYRKAFENPGVYKAVGQYPALQRIAKQLGIDPGKVRELVPEMANYDMWQHTPGMALAFGLPFGIGAITGHPGWGALLGLLGAGGYGYYQYNKMQGAAAKERRELEEKLSAPPNAPDETAAPADGEPNPDGETPAPAEDSDDAAGDEELEAVADTLEDTVPELEPQDASDPPPPTSRSIVAEAPARETPKPAPAVEKPAPAAGGGTELKPLYRYYEFDSEDALKDALNGATADKDGYIRYNGNKVGTWFGSNDYFNYSIRSDRLPEGVTLDDSLPGRRYYNRTDFEAAHPQLKRTEKEPYFDGTRRYTYYDENGNCVTISDPRNSDIVQLDPDSYALLNPRTDASAPEVSVPPTGGPTASTPAETSTPDASAAAPAPNPAPIQSNQLTQSSFVTPPANSVEKNSPASQQQIFYPWRVVKSNKYGRPTSVWNQKGNSMFTMGADGKWYRGDGGRFRGPQASQGEAAAINEAIQSGAYLLDNSIPNLPNNITFMGENGMVYDGKKQPLGMVHDNRFIPARDVPEEWENKSSEEIWPKPSPASGPIPYNRYGEYLELEDSIGPWATSTDTYDAFTGGVLPPDWYQAWGTEEYNTADKAHQDYSDEHHRRIHKALDAYN